MEPALNQDEQLPLSPWTLPSLTSPFLTTLPSVVTFNPHRTLNTPSSLRSVSPPVNFHFLTAPLPPAPALRAGFIPPGIQAEAGHTPARASCPSLTLLAQLSRASTPSSGPSLPIPWGAQLGPSPPKQPQLPVGGSVVRLPQDCSDTG